MKRTLSVLALYTSFMITATLSSSSASAQPTVAPTVRFQAMIEIGKARMNLAEAIAKSVIGDKAAQCTEQFPILRIFEQVSPTLQNLLFQMKRAGEIDRSATMDDLLKNYPALSKVIDGDISLKASALALYSRMGDDSFAMVGGLLEGRTVYQQTLPRRGEKQPSYTFLANGVVQRADKNGDVTTGTWTLEKVSLYQVFAQVKIEVDGEEKILAFTRNAPLNSIFTGVFGFTALAGFTVDPNDGRKLVYSEDEVYTSVRYDCLAYAQ